MATILIVFHHYQQLTGARFDTINFFNGRFYFGYIVEFFFVLSGYFMYPYVERIGGGEGYTFREFISRRISRLLPLVAIGAIGYEFLAGLYQYIYHTSCFGIELTVWGTIIASLGIQDGWALANPCVNNPTWYISVLILCYVVFYLLSYISKRLKVSPFYFYVFMIFVGMGIQTYGINFPFFNGSSSRGYYAFFWGLVVAWYIKNTKVTWKLELLSSAIVLLIILLIVGNYSIMSTGINYILTFIFYPALIIVFLSKPIRTIFKSSKIGTLGKISFDTYIWHNALFILMYICIALFDWTIDLNRMTSMGIFTLITFAVGASSYFLIEVPINKLLVKKTNV